MNGRDTDAVRMVARVLMETGKYADARTLLSGLAAAGEADAFVRRNLAYALLRLGDYGEAEKLTRPLAGEEDSAAALFLHAYALWGKGDTDEAKRVVDRYAASLAREEKSAADPRETGR